MNCIIVYTHCLYVLYITKIRSLTVYKKNSCHRPLNIYHIGINETILSRYSYFENETTFWMNKLYVSVRTPLLDQWVLYSLSPQHESFILNLNTLKRIFNINPKPQYIFTSLSSFDLIRINDSPPPFFIRWFFFPSFSRNRKKIRVFHLQISIYERIFWRYPKTYQNWVRRENLGS